MVVFVPVSEEEVELLGIGIQQGLDGVRVPGLERLAEFLDDAVEVVDRALGQHREIVGATGGEQEGQ